MVSFCQYWGHLADLTVTTRHYTAQEWVVPEADLYDDYEPSDDERII